MVENGRFVSRDSEGDGKKKGKIAERLLRVVHSIYNFIEMK